MFTIHRPKILPCLALGALSLSLFLGKSWDTSLKDIDSNLHASLSLRVTGGETIFPMLPMTLPVEGSWKNPGLAEHPLAFNDHPFLPFWLSGWVMRALGPSSFSAKLLPALFGVGSVLLLVWIGTLLRSFVFGLSAGLILLLTREFVINAASFHLDQGMIFFILLSFGFWLSGAPLSAGIAAGIGTWMKSPVALLLFPVSLLTPPRGGLIRQSWVLSAICALGTLSLIWVLTGAIGGWELVRDYWERQVLGTVVDSRGGKQGLELLFFPKVLLRTYWPWLLFVLWGVVRSFREGSFRERRVLIPLVTAVLGSVIITLLRFKYSYYYLPVFPFLALLAAESIRPWVEKRQATFIRALITLGVFVPTILLVTPIPQGQEPFPSMRVFAPEITVRIQDCNERILIIPSGEETGTSLDLQYHSVFYTSLGADRAECAEVRDIFLGPRGETYRYILGDQASIENCLPDFFQREFKSRFTYLKRALWARNPAVLDRARMSPMQASTRCSGQ